MAKEIEKYRDYTMEDAEFLSKARTKHAHFLNYLADFTAFDANLNAAYAADWALQIESCETHQNDETTLDQQQQYTEDLEKAKKQGFIAANDLEYYVKKAFRDEPRTQKEFGFNLIKQARARTLNQIMWMEVMRKIAQDYTAELTAVDMPASVISNLETAAHNIVQAEIEQEYYKRIRLRLTTQRMKKFNALYATCKLVNSAAQIVFFDKKEEAGLFEI
ncbi:MAG: hypothetical protein AB7G44_13025 [Bacteroidia bacterium]